MGSRTGSRRNSLSKGKEMTSRVLHEFLLTPPEKRLFRGAEDFHRSDVGDCEPSAASDPHYETMTPDIILQWFMKISKHFGNSRSAGSGPSLARPTETHIRRRLGNQTRVQQQRQMSPLAGSGPGGGRARPIRRPGSPGGAMQPVVRKKRSVPPGQGTMKRVHRLARPTASSRQKADAGRTKSKMIRSRSGRAARPSSKAAMHHHTQSGDVAGVTVGGRAGMPRRSRSRPADAGSAVGSRLSGAGPTQLLMSRNLSSPIPASADETESAASSTAGGDWDDGEPEDDYSDWDDDPDAVELHLDTEAFGDDNVDDDEDPDEDDDEDDDEDGQPPETPSAAAAPAAAAAAAAPGPDDFPPSPESAMSSDPGDVPETQV